MANLVFMPNVAPRNAQTVVPLDQIPQDVKDDVEQVYEMLKTYTGRMRAAFDTVEELRQYITFVTSYCEQRPAGQIRFRKSPTKKLPATTMDFRITDMLTKEEEVTEAIRENVEEVKTAAKAPKVAAK